MKIFANALALSILLALLAACGDESSSSVSTTQVLAVKKFPKILLARKRAPIRASLLLARRARRNLVPRQQPRILLAPLMAIRTVLPSKKKTPAEVL